MVKHSKIQKSLITFPKTVMTSPIPISHSFRGFVSIFDFLRELVKASRKKFRIQFCDLAWILICEQLHTATVAHHRSYLHVLNVCRAPR